MTTSTGRLSSGSESRPVVGWSARWPWLLVAAAIIWNLVNLRAVTLGVAYLDDGSLHEQMVRFATSQLRAGHLPLTSWFPFLGEGSAQFLHYQSLPAMITGAVGLITGPDTAFRWSMYLLLSLWPVSIYLSARLFGAGRAAAAVSAAMSPFLVSATGVGYEQGAYVWIGYGVWTQLWASWTLPLCWGFSWRALRDGRGYLRAVFFTALTVALHFETGYLALAVLLFWPWVAGRSVLTRVRRAAVVLIGALLTSAWVVIPLLSQRNWAAVNEPLQATGLVNGYGAGKVLHWIVAGQLLDNGRLPVITVCAAIGFGLAWLTWMTDPDARALLIALAVCLFFAFGRATWGSLINVIPGNADLFFRRFEMGVQLVALLLAGRGVAWLAEHARRFAAGRLADGGPELARLLADPRAIAASGILLTAAILTPAWLQLGSYDRANAGAVNAQRLAERTQGAQLSRLIAVIKRQGGGRTYAGLPTNSGADFTVGSVPVFKYLESRDVDEVGYTLRTASLMTDPEYNFDSTEASDYTLFGIRYLILPSSQQPPVPAQLTMTSGQYALWTLPANGYISAGEITGSIDANRTDVGTRSIALLQSDLTSRGGYLTVNYPSDGPSGVLNGRPPTQNAAGTVSAEHTDLANGIASATVTMSHAGIAVLSASYDSGWSVTVNGRPASTRMAAPATVAVDVPAGTSRVVFRYHGYDGYPELFVLAGLTLAALMFWSIRGMFSSAQSRRAASGTSSDSPSSVSP